MILKTVIRKKGQKVTNKKVNKFISARKKEAKKLKAVLKAG